MMRSSGLVANRLTVSPHSFRAAQREPSRELPKITQLKQNRDGNGTGYCATWGFRVLNGWQIAVLKKFARTPAIRDKSR